MKNKLIYIFIFIFSISIFSSAKKIKGTCSTSCCQLNMQKCSEPKEADDSDESEFTLPSLGLFLINI